jgi:hypothetical protein
MEDIWKARDRWGGNTEYHPPVEANPWRRQRFHVRRNTMTLICFDNSKRQKPVPGCSLAQEPKAKRDEKKKQFNPDRGDLVTGVVFLT